MSRDAGRHRTAKYRGKCITQFFVSGMHIAGVVWILVQSAV